MAQNFSKKFSEIGANIKKIRQVKNISQADFASLFELARPSVGAYEEGRSEPKIETVIAIANYFRISIDVLLTRELTVSEIYSMDQLNQKLDKAHGKDKITTSAIKPLPSDKSMALVGLKEYVEYIINHKAVNFTNDLEQIHVPIKKKGKYRAFEMNGSEMEYHQQGLHHGDVLISKLIELAKDKPAVDKVYVVVHNSQITTRRLEAIKDGKMTFVTDDPNYETVIFPSQEILELWEVKMVISRYLKRPSLLEERLLQLEKDIKSLKKH